MNRTASVAAGLAIVGLLMAVCFLVGLLLPAYVPSFVQVAQAPTPTVAITESIPTPSLEPSITSTLKPPPTFEPPTLTPLPSITPSITPSPTLLVQVDIPGLNTGSNNFGIGGSPSPSPEEECEPREDWGLRHTVGVDDTLDGIARQYGTNYQELARANCLKDANIIGLGQELRVPGELPFGGLDCTWEVITPIDGAFNVEGDSNLTFHWRGPESFRSLIRVIQPNGEIWEKVVDVRQNEQIFLIDELPQEGEHIWWVYPLDRNFVQIGCPEGGPWTFHKQESPTITPSPSPLPTETITDTPDPDATDVPDNGGGQIIPVNP